ncbi:metallophosphoesterase [Haliscomenobacter sp.]|uniref:metallophosphoesterase n=1 Tax=Haliscomenobacter sp. TaxID=2717303 RepID=UPI003593584D
MRMCLFILLLLLNAGLILAQNNAVDTKFLVQPYLQFSTQNGMYVLWETKEPATTLVQFGEARANADQVVLDREVRLEGQRLMHEILLDNLKTETNYFWQVTTVTQSGERIQTPVYTFKTAVKDSSAYLFGLVGDTQRNNRTPWAWGKIAEKLWQDRPNFVVHAGDVVDQGLDKKDWIDNFFPNGQILMSRVPVYTVLGNHEQDAPYYYQYMVAPAPEYYYTFKYGNAQFFMIDSNRDLKEGSEQYNWLEWELAKSTATWKIAVHHHPPYSSDSDDHGNTSRELSTLGTDARNLVPLYERYGLDFCLFGHTHLYERSWPLKENRINMKDGVVYINSGGAGGGLEEFAPTRSWFTMDLQIVHHYCTFAIFENNLVFKAVDHEGRLFDTFQMQKDAAKGKTASVIQPPAPNFSTPATLFQDQTTVDLSAAFEGLQIRYTLDGSEPNRNSALYSQALTIKQSTMLKTRAYTQDGRASRVVMLNLRKMAAQAAQKVKKVEKGLKFSYYEGAWTKLPDFKTLTPVKTGISNQVGLAEIGHRDNQFGVVMEGYIEVAQTGTQTFFLNSDDGSKLYINGELIIDHDGDHSAIKKTGQSILAAGKHKIRIEYFERSGGQFLQAGLMDEKMGAVPFTPFQLHHE